MSLLLSASAEKSGLSTVTAIRGVGVAFDDAARVIGDGRDIEIGILQVVVFDAGGIVAERDRVDVVRMVNVLLVGCGGSAYPLFQDLPLLVVIKMPQVAGAAGFVPDDAAVEAVVLVRLHHGARVVLRLNHPVPSIVGE